MNSLKVFAAATIAAIFISVLPLSGKVDLPETVAAHGSAMQSTPRPLRGSSQGEHIPTCGGDPEVNGGTAGFAGGGTRAVRPEGFGEGTPSVEPEGCY